MLWRGRSSDIRRKRAPHAGRGGNRIAASEPSDNIGIATILSREGEASIAITSGPLSGAGLPRAAGDGAERAGSCPARRYEGQECRPRRTSVT